MDAEKKEKLMAIIPLAACLFIVALSWMILRMSAIWTDIEFSQTGSESDMLSTYMICEIIMIPLAGKLSDRYGERPILAIGIFVYFIGAMGCGMSSDMDMLLISRCIQGLGAGFIFSVALSIVGILYEVEERGSPHKLMTGAFAFGSIFGTMIGFWFATTFSWRFSFFFCAAIMVIAGLFAYIHLPERKSDRPADLIGMFVLCALYLGYLLYSQWIDNGVLFISQESLIVLAILIIVSIVFYIRQSRLPNPAAPAYSTGAQVKCFLTMFLVSMMAIGMLQYLIKMVMVQYSLDIYNASELMLWLIVGGAITSTMGCKRVHKTGIMPWIILGGLVTMVGFILIGYMGNYDLMFIRIGLFVLGLGLGSIVTEIVCTLQLKTKKENMGSVTGNLMAIRMSGIVIGIAAYSVIIKSLILNFLMEKGIIIDFGGGDLIEFLEYLFVYLSEETFTELVNYFDYAIMICSILAGITCFIIIACGVTIGYEDVDEE